MGYVKAAAALLIVAASMFVLGIAESKAVLPGGVGIEAGDYVVKEKFALIVYGRGEAGPHSMVVVCTGAECFLGNVTGESRGALLVSGDPAMMPAPVNPRSPGLYIVKAVVPLAAWLPLLLVAAAASAYYAYTRAGVGLALLFLWVYLVLPFYSLSMPEIYTGVPKPPRAELVAVEATSDYRGVILEADLGGGVFSQPSTCNITVGNETFPAIAYAEGNRLYVAVPSDAWREAAEYYRSRSVFLKVNCLVGLKGMGEALVQVSVPVWVKLPDPRVVVEDDRVIIENPAPVAMRLVGTVYYQGPLERIPINETILPGERIVIELAGHRKMVLEGVIQAPWGEIPVGAILP